METRKGTNSLRTNQSASIKEVNIKDSFWKPQMELVRKVVIPYQWEALNDRVEGAEPSHAMRNLKIAAGLMEGEFKGFFFQDSDLAKWLEAVAYTLAVAPDEALEKLADEAIDIVKKAQQEDGYLNSYFTLVGKEKRWTNLEECHELYTAGHFIEAGVAYYEATGKRNLLDIVCRLADYIDTVFGEEPEKIHGYDGHEEIELALMRLYHATGKENYKKLAKYFIDERGKEPCFFTKEWERRNHISAWGNKETSSPEVRREYYQAHEIVRKQKKAVGHAVRQVYLLSGMAEVAAESGDQGLFESCKTLWNNIVNKQMYITGGIGSTNIGEAFTFDYDLPNDTVYAETCASVGLIGFANRMLQIEADSTYADVMERVLFNLIVGSMSKDGKHYFYVNPLEVWPEASEKSPIRHHVKAVRQPWFGCACCPPNLARLLSSLGQYIYSTSKTTLYVHQFISSEFSTSIAGGKIRICQSSNYPWEGTIEFLVKTERIKTAVEESAEHKNAQMDRSIAIRIPGWCKTATLTCNGENVDIKKNLRNGYVIIHLEVEGETKLTLNLDMPVERIRSNPKLRANIGKAAIMRGPVVYCLEEADNGANLPAIRLRKEEAFMEEWEEDLHVIKLISKEERLSENDWSSDQSNMFHQSDTLYRSVEYRYEEFSMTAVPYCVWGNRTPGEMLVWIRCED